MALLDSFIKYIENSIVEYNEMNAKNQLYHSFTNVSIKTYIYSLVQYIKTDNLNGTILYTIIIFNRIKKYMIVNKFTVHKIILISILLANKYYDDLNFDNDVWSTIGGIKLKSLNKLEFKTTKLIKYNIFASYKQLEYASRVVYI